MSVVQEILSWWWAQMRDLLPARFGQADLHADALIADARPHDPDIALIQRRNRREIPLAPRRTKVGLSARRILLRLPASAVLERKLTLPAATLSGLDRVLGYEIDRVSPFSAAELAWTYAVERHDGGRIHLVLALLPRAALSPALATLRDAGVAPTAALVPRASGGIWRIPLVASDHSPRLVANRRALQTVVAACALLAVAAAVLPFVLQASALRQTEARIEALGPEVAQANALRRQIADRASGLDAVAAETTRVGRVLEALATLTNALPDDTYLTALALHQRAFTMTGRSASAARLIPLLESDPAMRNAAFAAPVTRSDGTKGDIFSIRADLRP